MKMLLCAMLILAATASAAIRTGGSGAPNPWASRGSYTVEDIMAGGLSGTYGLAIKDNVPNSIWILDYSEMINMEFDMLNGSQTGNSWAITGGVDPDDQAYCEYGSGNQWFMTDYSASFFSVFAEDGSYLRDIDGPSSYIKLFGIGAGGGYIYVSSPGDSKLAWGAYTGTETTITWSDMDYSSVYGLAVYGGYLFVACGIEAEDNIFIHAINPDGSPNPTPEWSCTFTENTEVNGGIDYDGTYLWVYPQQDFLYKLSIDWDPESLENDTWAAIKASF